MLILTRREGESIQCRLPDGTVGWIHINHIGSCKASIGLDFPVGVRFFRPELLLQRIDNGTATGKNPQHQA